MSEMSVYRVGDRVGFWGTGRGGRTMFEGVITRFGVANKKRVAVIVAVIQTPGGWLHERAPWRIWRKA